MNRQRDARYVLDLLNPGERVRMHSLGGGLILRVAKSGAGSWVQRITINGRRKDIGLGPTRTVSLKQAREWANLNRYRVLTGHPDAVVGIADMRCPDPSTAPYFGEFAKEVVESRLDLKRDEQRRHWMSTFENHCWLLYRKRIDEIRRQDIIAVFEERVDGGEILWTAKPAAAKLALQRLGYVFTVAMGREIITENPADAAPVRAALPRLRGTGGTRHHKAIPHAELGAFLAGLNPSRTAHAATVFLALTTTRRNEVLEADWSEVELEARLWTIPAGRAKTNRDHVVPLSRAAVRVLDGTHARSNRTGRIFPISRTSVQKVFSNSGGTAHGLRSAFRSWCQEAGKAREIAELCLGHRIGSAVEQAYARSNLLEQRRALMSEWADYLGKEMHAIKKSGCASDATGRKSS